VSPARSAGFNDPGEAEQQEENEQTWEHGFDSATIEA